jgi:hypothetical protein
VPGHGQSFPATPGTYPVTASWYANDGSNVGKVVYADTTFDVTGTPGGGQPTLARTGLRRAGISALP